MFFKHGLPMIPFSTNVTEGGPSSGEQQRRGEVEDTSVGVSELGGGTAAGVAGRKPKHYSGWPKAAISSPQ